MVETETTGFPEAFPQIKTDRQTSVTGERTLMLFAEFLLSVRASYMCANKPQALWPVEQQ